EHINHIVVRNLADALSDLHAAGFHTVGLDSEAGQPLERALEGRRLALVLGAEGKGLRQKTRQTVRMLAQLDMPGAIRSLNVSNAAAVALYVARRFLDGSGQPCRRLTWPAQTPAGAEPPVRNICPRDSAAAGMIPPLNSLNLPLWD